MRSIKLLCCLAGPIGLLLSSSVARADYVAVVWSDDTVRLLDNAMQQVGSFPAGATNPNGVGTDGTLIYTGHYTSQEVVARDFAGVEQFRWTASIANLQGLSLVSTELAVADNGLIEFYVPATGVFIRQIPSPVSVEGLGFDGTLLWMIDDTTLVGVDPADGTVLSTIPNAAAGCTYQGTGIAPSQAGELTLACLNGDWFVVSAADGSVINSGNNGLDMYGLEHYTTAVDDCPGQEIDVTTLTPASGNSLSVTGTTAGASNDILEGTEIACWMFSEAVEHVHQFTLTANTMLQIDLQGSAYDTKMAIVDGCPGGTSFCLYSDDYDMDVTSGFDCQEYAAGTYSVVVTGFLGELGAYSLNLEECAPVCGDGAVEGLEECDDMGETATCDDDCTMVSCGDGTTNATALETCDDMGESATCDADCSAAVCGDGAINATALETCDDSAETATCDDDCTAAECGDGTVNATALEGCDDGNTTGGDGCSSTCTDEGTGGMGGGMAGAGGAGATGGMGGGMGGSGAGGTAGADAEDDGAATDDGGCDCATPGAAGDSWRAGLLALVGAALMRRRRRAA